MQIYRQIGVTLLCRDLSSINRSGLSRSLNILEGDLPPALQDSAVDSSRIPLLEVESLGGSLQTGVEYHAVRYLTEDGAKWCIQVARIDPSMVQSDEERWAVSVGPLVYSFNTIMAKSEDRWPRLLNVLSDASLASHRGLAIGPDLSLICGAITEAKRKGVAISALSDFLWPVQVGKCSDLASKKSYWAREFEGYCFKAFHSPKGFYGWLSNGISPVEFGVSKRWVSELLPD